MNLYLSRLILNPRSRQVSSEVAFPYEMHRTLMRAFPESASAARQEHGVLFRVDSPKSGQALILYVQSIVQPNWTFLEKDGKYLDHSSPLPPVSCRDILPALGRMDAGRVLSFRLRANPTRRIGRKDDPLQGKRVGILKDEEQIAWLARKGKERTPGVPGGFELVSMKQDGIPQKETPLLCVNVNPEGTVRGRKHGQGQEHTMKHHSVVFEGQLRVTDPEAFLQTVIHGVGTAKAFGFGLVTLASASRSNGLRS